MKWVNEKLIPTFERLHPGKKMVLVADNAPYHHQREIGSLANVTKKKLIEMMKEDGVDWIELPLTEPRIKLVDDEEDDDVQDRGDCIHLTFNANEQSTTPDRPDHAWQMCKS